MGKIYTMANMWEYIDAVDIKKKTGRYIGIIGAFDTETSSFYDVNNEKTAILYEWTLCLNGLIIYGRTCEEFRTLCDSLAWYYKTNTKSARLCVYVHNLSYDFQFIRKYLEWSEVFAMSSREVLYAVTTGGIEFRCSYKLTNLSLDRLAKNIKGHDIKKLYGSLDYRQVRTPETPLTEEELEYCFNDVLIIFYYIQEELKNNDLTLQNIPLTKTGYVRDYTRKKIKTPYGGKYRDAKNMKEFKKYRELMNSLTLEPEEYQLLKSAFMGGFTHASVLKSGTVFEDVDSFDFTSSYPSVMIAEKFPMSKGKRVEVRSMEEFERYMSLFCCVFTVRFTDIRSKIDYEHYITSSKCYMMEGEDLDNGRVISADTLTIDLTDVDFKIIKNTYEWKHLEIANFWIYEKAYLPSSFVSSILDLYEAKTKLKGVEGSEVYYQNSKGMLNSEYGMSVTDINRNETSYNNKEDTWSEVAGNLSENIEKVNGSKKRFLFYPWGVFITAYARRNLWTGIMEFGHDYIYSDTDSIKVLNIEKHSDYIKQYNAYTLQKLTDAMEFHGFDVERIKPKTIKGEEKPLGVWDWETKGDPYRRFKTLGAKRYMYENSHGINITIAGVNKKKGAEYMASLSDPFGAFNNGLYFDKEHSGKLTHTYIDETREGVALDYLGNYYTYSQQSGVHLEPSDYSLTMSEGYLKLINRMKMKELVK